MIRKLLSAISLAAAMSGPALAEFDPPDGPVILRVTGELGRSNVGEAAEFDRALLESVGWIEIETRTMFTEGPQRFAGVPLDRLLDFVEASGDVLRARALNDYSVTIPVSDAETHDVLLALDWNGEAMRVRDKGPIWVIYPSNIDGRDRAHNERMIWQLDSLHVE